MAHDILHCEFGEQYYVQGTDTSGYFSDASSPLSSCSATSSPVPSPTIDSTYQYWQTNTAAEQCSGGYDCYTWVNSPTYTSLTPVDSTTLRLTEASSDVHNQFPSTTIRRTSDVQVFQITTNEFCARLGKHEYPFDVNDTFENCFDYHLTKTLPVSVSEKNCTQISTSQVRRTTNGTVRNRKLPRAERLWEFILRLLLDANYNPSHIEWVDRERGMFRLVNSRQIAKMWGKRKNNYDMTYEKLSRAMRYYYHRKILQPVFGKKLVYKFGPNSTGWQLTQ